jgi:hypothetical protein
MLHDIVVNVFYAILFVAWVAIGLTLFYIFGNLPMGVWDKRACSALTLLLLWIAVTGGVIYTFAAA